MADAPKDTAADVPKDVNGRGLWPFFSRRQEWRDKVEEEAVRKFYDLPKDDMNLNRTTTGISAKGAMGIAAIAGIPPTLAASALGAAMIFGGKDSAPTVPTPEPVVTNEGQDGIKDIDLLFYDKDGNPISVPHISTRPKDQP